MGKQISMFSRNDYEDIAKLAEELHADSELYYHKDNRKAGTRLTVGLRKLELMARRARHGVYQLKKERGLKKK